MGEQQVQSILENYPFETPAKIVKVSSPIQSDDALLFSSTTRKIYDLAEFKHSKSNLVGDQFWSTHSNVFPELFALYRKLLPIQLTNASVERLFSQANLVYDNLSGSLDPETIFSKLVLKKNQ